MSGWQKAHKDQLWCNKATKYEYRISSIELGEDSGTAHISGIKSGAYGIDLDKNGFVDLTFWDLIEDCPELNLLFNRTHRVVIGDVYRIRRKKYTVSRFEGRLVWAKDVDGDEVYLGDLVHGHLDDDSASNLIYIFQSEKKKGWPDAQDLAINPVIQNAKYVPPPPPTPEELIESLRPKDLDKKGWFYACLAYMEIPVFRQWTKDPSCTRLLVAAAPAIAEWIRSEVGELRVISAYKRATTQNFKPVDGPWRYRNKR